MHEPAMEIRPPKMRLMKVVSLYNLVVLYIPMTVQANL
jgi:hypothetical protein